MDTLTGAFGTQKINPRIIKIDKKMKKRKFYPLLKLDFQVSYRIIIKARYGTIKYAADFVNGRIRFVFSVFLYIPLYTCS